MARRVQTFRNPIKKEKMLCWISPWRFEVSPEPFTIQQAIFHKIKPPARKASDPIQLLFINGASPRTT